MKRVLTLTLAAFALLLFAQIPAEAASSLCPDNGNTAYIIDTAAAAADVASGYTNVTCDVTIKTSINPSVVSFKISAKTITVQGPDVLNAGQNVQIVNQLGA